MAVSKLIEKELTPKCKYILELSDKEAQLLSDLLQHIGGCPAGSRRKYAVSILGALRSANIKNRYNVSDIKGSIDCKPNKGSEETYDKAY